MAKTQYLEYTINLTDKSLVEDMQALHPNGIAMAPETASLTYDAFMITTGNTWTPPPNITSPWFPTNSQYPRNVATFTRKIGGWFGIGFLFGTTVTYHWVGTFKYLGGADTLNGTVVEDVAIAKTKFMVGFESGEPLEMLNAGSGASNVMREASRHADGMGYYYASSSEYVVAVTQSGDAGTNKEWDRIYIKPMAEANVTSRMHRFKLSGGAGRGCSLNFTVDRRLVVHNISDAGLETPIGTSSAQYEIGRWYKIDLLLEAKAPGGNIRVYVDGVLIMTALGVGTGANGGINNNDTISNAYVGGGSAGSTTDTFQCYFDDWRGSEWPSTDSGGRYVGKDWLNGTRVVLVRPNGTATGNAWLGDYRAVAGDLEPVMVGSLAAGGNAMTSIVSGDALRLTVDRAQIERVPGSLGVSAFMVAYYGKQQTAGSGTVGWKFDGLIDLAAHANAAEGTANAVSRRWYRPSGAIDPIANLVPFELHKIKAANVNMAECYAFVLIAEHIGVFGDCDVKADDTDAVPDGLPAGIHGAHMSPYPTTPWAMSRLPVPSPVIIHTGTYTGNGTVQELQFRGPVTWLMIKRVPNSSTGGFWWTTLAGFHAEGEQSAQPSIQALVDPAFVPTGVEDSQEHRTIVRINGAHAQLNAAATAYEYVAFIDPGARYMLNGGFHALSTAFATLAIRFRGHSVFTPRWSFMHCELHSTVSATYERGTKGPGHAAPNASIMNIAETAAGWTHDAGGMTADDLLMDTAVGQNKPWSAWRSDDQSSDPNKLGVVAIGTYTGDGAASRTINFATTGTKRPVYAIVQPLNATPAHHRDPSNLTNTSNAMGTGTSTTTGITAGGVDSFTVGVTLNANGIVYNYFVLIGSATAGNGGWSIDGEFAVVEPDSPSDGDFDDTDPDDPDAEVPDPDPDPGPDDADDCLDGAVCVAATTKIVNLALLEIGVLKVLTNYCTQDTREAVVARQVYEQCVRHTLITYPWPFATKYATLALIATQPSHEDWTYAYRMPIDCIFPRRFVVTRGTAVDPSPPPMGLSSDDSGGILFGNEPNAILEYTARPGCVGFNGDDLFREALKWRLAAALAPPLTRIAGEAERCLKMFEVIVQKAESIVKQGVPGLRGAASTLDTTAAARAANVQVVNMALVKIGSRTIANLTTEQTREAVAANLVFEDTLRQVLRDFPWAFATRYVDPATLVDGAEGDPTTPDWTFSHRLPTDFVFLRRLVLEGTGRSFDPDPFPYRIGSDDVGGLLYSNVEEPILEYTARLQNVLIYADPLFREALSWKLAATLAPSLASVELHRPEQHGRGPETPQDPTRRIAQRYNDQSRRISIAQWANVMYERTLMDAKVADRNESQPEPHADADWIRGRE